MFFLLSVLNCTLLKMYCFKIFNFFKNSFEHVLKQCLFNIFRIYRDLTFYPTTGYIWPLSLFLTWSAMLISQTFNNLFKEPILVCWSSPLYFWYNVHSKIFHYITSWLSLFLLLTIIWVKCITFPQLLEMMLMIGFLPYSFLIICI